MLTVVEQTIQFYLQNNSVPNQNDLDIKDTSLADKKWACFVTVYKDWNIRWSAWVIKELHDNIINELISNAIDAISRDSRFSPLTSEEVADLKIRIDVISDRAMLTDKKLSDINPISQWVIVIKKDYTKLAVILPNISTKITTWNDFYPILSKKLWEEYVEAEYINYEINTEQLTNF